MHCVERSVEVWRRSGRRPVYGRVVYWTPRMDDPAMSCFSVWKVIRDDQRIILTG